VGSPLGLEDVSVDAKAQPASHALKGVFKDSSACVGPEQGTAVITTESYEMALPGVLITRKAPMHSLSVACEHPPARASPIEMSELGVLPAKMIV
jgi:hypothetical protein